MNKIIISILITIVALHAQNTNKPTVAVMNFDVIGMDASASILLTDRFRAELIKTNNYDVMERAKMDEILKEQGFQQSGACNRNECIVQVGKILGSTMMIAGSIGKFGQIYTVSARIVDVETGRILVNETEDCPCPMEKVLARSMRNIAMKLVNSSPVPDVQKLPELPPTSVLDTKNIITQNDATRDHDIGINTIQDIDGNVYKTVKIGSQLWMAENLKVTHYRNGDAIPKVTDNIAWINLSTGAYCNYNNDEANVAKYGRLYNWYAVNDSRNVAPSGWHVPTDAEWQTLVDYLGGPSIAGGKMKVMGIELWNNPNIGATNQSGFSALPGGYRYSIDGYFLSIGNYAYFWSDTEHGSDNAWRLYLEYLDWDVSIISLDKHYGLSVRLVRD